MQGTKVIHIFVPFKRKGTMKVDNVKSQMRKGMLEYCIMLLLHKEPAYASDIIQKLKEAQLIVVEGTLYPLLTRLKNDDLLSSIRQGSGWISLIYLMASLNKKLPQ